MLAALEPLFDGKVGAPMNGAAYAAAHKEGKRRAEAGEPPGFADQQKTKRGDPVGAAGDYLVWEQAIQAAETRQLNLLIVTADMKPDWWRVEGPFKRGPRVELVTELRKRSGAQLFMMRPNTLLSHAKSALSVEADESSVAEVERAGRGRSVAGTSTEAAELQEALQSADALWVQTAKLYANLGSGVGNQLDTPRGTRDFFGFDGDPVPPKTFFGYVQLQVPGHAPESRSVRFGNNGMDKINLPRPGLNGPTTMITRT